MKKTDPDYQMSKCPYYDTCAAPICPLHNGSLEHGVWYPDEEVCRRREFCKQNWIQNQKKIVSKNNKKSIPGYFTVKMLNRKIIIKGGIVGLDSDKAGSVDEKRWIDSHPEQKISKERIEKARQMAKERWAHKN